MTHHHCGCKMLPPDFEANLLAMHAPDAFVAQVLEFAGLAPRAKTVRVRRHFGPIDDAGHLRYIGKMPSRSAQPLLTYQGRRIPAANYAMAVYGNDPFAADLPLKRISDCRVPDCFAPAHWTYAQTPSPTYDPGDAEAVYVGRFGPEPKYHYYKRFGPDPFEPQCPAGHALSVRIGDPKRNAYCKQCYTKWHAWTKQHRDWQRNPMLRTEAFSYVLKLYREDPSAENLGPLGALWAWLDHWRAAHPADTRSAEDLHLQEYGAGPASTTDYADLADGSSPEPMTIADAIDWDEFFKDVKP